MNAQTVRRYRLLNPLKQAIRLCLSAHRQWQSLINLSSDYWGQVPHTGLGNTQLELEPSKLGGSDEN